MQFVVARLNLAFALLRAEDPKEAQTVFRSILEDDPTEPIAMAKLEELETSGTPGKRRPLSRGSTR